MKKDLSILLCLILTGVMSVCAGCVASSVNESAYMPQFVRLRVDDYGFSVTDANGSSLTHQDDFSGSMTIIDQSHIDTADKAGGEYILAVPMSEKFTYRNLSGNRQIFGVLIYEDDGVTEYNVSGTGIDQITIDCDGKISVNGDSMAFIAFLSMPCNGLGELGCVRFYGTAKSEASFRVSGDTLEFTGVTTETAAISYAGDGSINNPYVFLDLSHDTGTIDFHDVAEGDIYVTEDGKSRTIST